VLLAACGERREQVPAREEEPLGTPVPPFSLTLSGVGFSAPGAVIHDGLADVYLVSNGGRDKGGIGTEGFVSRVSPEGRILELRWIDGDLPGVTLHSPAGMTLVEDTLFVADGKCVRRFERVSGTPLRDLCLEEAHALRDVTATPRGDLFFSDGGSDGFNGGLYLLRQTADVPQTVTLRDGTVMAGAEAGRPWGLFADRRGLYVATHGSGELYRITPEGEQLQMLFPSDAGLSGIVSLEERGFLYSCWRDSAVHWIHGDGTISAWVEGLEAPADLGYDMGRNRALVPLLRQDEVLILEVR